jgi:hypothetical protein
MNTPPVDSLSTAESAAAERMSERDRAAATLQRAQGIEARAREAHTRAVTLATEAESAHAAAVEIATAAETRWTASQTADLWRAVENARGARDQTELRARSLRLAAENAAADLDTARQRTEDARGAHERAESAARRAEDIRRAWQRHQDHP